MSYTVLESGKLKKIFYTSNVEDLKKFCKEHEIEFNEYSYTSGKNEIVSTDYERYCIGLDVLKNYVVFEVLNCSKEESNGYLEIFNKVSPDTFDFVLEYYNGGCSGSEIIENWIKRQSFKEDDIHD